MTRILVVDDEQEIADNVSEIIREKLTGVLVDVAYSGRKAREMLIGGAYDLLLTDIGMPVVGGFDLLAFTQERKMDIPVVFLTGYHDFDIVYKAAQHKNVRYLVKTESDEKIAQTVADTLKERELAHENRQVVESARERLEQAELLLTRETVRRHMDSVDDDLKFLDDIDNLTGIILTVKRYIKEHLEEDVSLTAIAGALHFNPTYLSRVFKAGTGDKLSEYVNRKKMEAAKQLLIHTDESIQHISRRLGYESGQSFARSFKKYINLTPQEYRRRFMDTSGE